MPKEDSRRTGKDKGMTEEVTILDDAQASEALALLGFLPNVASVDPLLRSLE